MNLGNDKAEQNSPLEQYGVDLTTKARDGKLDPVIGRDSVRNVKPRNAFVGHVLLHSTVQKCRPPKYRLGLRSLIPKS